MTEVFNWEEEFRPLDDDAVDSLMHIAHELRSFKENKWVSDEDHETFEIAAHQLERLTAMTVGGFALYIQSFEHAEALSAEVERLMELCNKADIDEFQSWSIANEAFKVFKKELNLNDDE